ncbi:MAG: serine protease [Hyphomicrobiaceae bacterium]|nr:MAG: serine protease [Hyphomicrobiaceae bacterium]
MAFCSALHFLRIGTWGSRHPAWRAKLHDKRRSAQLKGQAVVQPDPEDYDYDLDQALASMVGIRSVIPADAFTAETLGTERAGNGVVIRADGVVLTIGYLIMEADTVWISHGRGHVVPGHVLGYDYESGLGLVQALGRLDLPALPVGCSGDAEIGEHVVVAGAGGRQGSITARIIARQEFAGYWEYVLDEAIFTAPAHPNWGGTALIGPGGDLLGVGSLQIQQAAQGGRGEDANMMVPIDLLRPIYNDLLTIGRPNRPARPWLGLYATEVENNVAVLGIASGGPAQSVDLQAGDIVLAVAGASVTTLASFFRGVWSLGNAGVDVPLLINREGETFEVRVRSADRRRFLKGPILH